MTQTPATAVEHPTWCDVAYCRPCASEERRHRGSPIIWRLDNGFTEVSVTRYQQGIQDVGVPSFELHLLDEDAGEIEVDVTRDDLVQILAVMDQPATLRSVG